MDQNSTEGLSSQRNFSNPSPSWTPATGGAAFELRLTDPHEPAPPRGHPILAWIAIFILIGILYATALLSPPEEEEQMLAQGASVLGQLEGRFLVGSNLLARDLGPEFHKGFREGLQQSQTDGHGPISQRLQAIAAAGEISGPDQALHAVRSLRDEVETSVHDLTPEEDRLLRLTESLFAKTQAKQDPNTDFKPDDRDFLIRQLGWSGRLILAPEDLSPPERRLPVIQPARRFALILCLVLFGGSLGLLIGCASIIMFFPMIALGWSRFGLPPGSRAGNAAAHGVYLEAFAVWLAVFQLGSFLLAQLPLGKMVFLGLGLNFLGSMFIGILWPLLRGIPWSVLRTDIGWTKGAGILVEPFFAVVGYLMTLPLLGFGLLLTILSMAIAGSLAPPEVAADPFAPIPLPMHPIVVWVAGGDRFVMFQVVLLACVLAPLIEETMFRGFLYRYLRDASRWTGPAFSFLFSVLLNSFIFAAIHPQGPFAIPPLMAIACGLTLLREWRGSLIAPMIAHGLNNSLVTVVLFGAVW